MAIALTLLLVSGNAADAQDSEVPVLQKEYYPDGTLKWLILRPDFYADLDEAWNLQDDYLCRIVVADSIIADQTTLIGLQKGEIREMGAAITYYTGLVEMLESQNAALQKEARRTWWEKNRWWIASASTAIVVYTLVK